MPRGNAAALNTPESREKRKATIKESVRRRKAIKAVESLGNLDLAPIDEQINDLEKQIARLKNAKKIILQLRGETPAAIEPGKPVNGVCASPPVEDLPPLDAIHACLKGAPPMGANEIAAKLAIPQHTALGILRNNRSRFVETKQGWTTVK